MASPFALFRRNQKIMFAVVGISVMFAFVFLQPMMTYLDRSRAPQDPVVVETKYGEYNESQLAAVRQSRELVLAFLQRAVEETVLAQIEKGQFDPRSRASMVQNILGQWHRRLLQRSKPGPEEAAIETLVLAQKAEELGMVVSDRAINDLLVELTFDSLTSERLQAIVNSLHAGRRVSSARLFDAIRTELLAANLSRLFQQSLNDFPPAQRFEYYSRLNRRADAQIMPLAVVDFTSQVKAPSDAELKEFFNKYKDQFPNAASPEPGFMEPRRAAFQYFKADFAKFTDDAKANVTEEEIRDYYEKNKAQFVQLDLPDEPQDEPQDESPDAESKPDDAASEKPDSEKSDDPTEEPAKADSEDDPSQDESTAADDDDKSNDDSERPGDQPTPDDEATPADPTADEPSKEAGTSEESAESDTPDEEASLSRPGGSFRLVSASTLAEQEPQDETSDESPSDPQPEPPAEGDTQEAPKTDDTQDKSPAADDEPAPETPKDSADSATEEPTPEPNDAPAEPSEAPADENSTPDDQPAPRYEPLEKVQDQIRDSIASRKAAERITEIFDELQVEMRQHADVLDIYDARNVTGSSLQPPKPFPFAELAKKYGVEAKELPPVTATEAAQEDIGTVTRFVPDSRSQFGFRQEPFVEFAFSSSLPLHRTNIVNDNEGNGYLFWKTKAEKSYVPKFDQVSEKVLAAWKMIEARPVARKRAEELAEQARIADKPLKEVFAGDAGLEVVDAPSFSWMTTGAVPQNPMGGPIRISEIEGLKFLGPAFMKTMFGLSVGEVGVTTNRPQDTVYVVQLEKYDQSLDALRDDFAKERPARYMSVANPDLHQMYLAWIDNLEKAADVRWVRPPDVARRRSTAEAEL